MRSEFSEPRGHSDFCEVRNEMKRASENSEDKEGCLGLAGGKRTTLLASSALSSGDGLGWLTSRR